MSRPTGVNAERRPTASGAPLWILPLGFQTPPLSLNGRYHWRTRNRKTRAIRVAVVVRGQQVKMHRCPHLYVQLHYVPRDRRARDADNLVATLKPAIDALTEKGRDKGWPALGLVPDDTPEYVTWSPPTIHDPDEHGPRLWLEVVGLSARPPVPSAYGGPSQPHTEGN